MKPGRHICTVCNYIYEEPGKKTESEQKLVPFDQLPENWNCPSCGGGKDMFQPCSCVSVTPAEAHEHTHHQAG
jgi:rubredoxin